MKFGDFKVSDLLLQALASNDKVTTDHARWISTNLDRLLFQAYHSFTGLPFFVDSAHRLSFVRGGDDAATLKSDQWFWGKADAMSREVGKDQVIMCFSVRPEDDLQQEIPVVYLGREELFIWPSPYKDGRYFIARRGADNAFEASCPLRLHAIVPAPLHWEVAVQR